MSTRNILALYFKDHDTLKAVESALNRVLPEGPTGGLTEAEANEQRKIMSRMRLVLRRDPGPQ